MNIKRAFFLIFIANSGNLASYLFQVLSARTMTPGDYGIFNALNSLVVLISSPIPVGNMLIAKMTIKVSSQGEQIAASLRNFLLKKGIILAILVWFTGFLSLPWLQKYFHLSQKTPLYILMAHAGLVMLIPIFSGMLQGLRLYLIQAIGLALFSWGRLASGGILAHDGHLTVSEALFCAFISTALVTALIAVFLKKKLGKTNPSQKFHFSSLLWKELTSSFPYLALNYFTIALFLNADLILARHYLSSEEVGLYAVAAIIGRIAFYLPGILVAVLFAESVRQTRERDLLKVGAFAGLTSFSFGSLCWIAPELLIRILMGIKYIGAAPYLRVIALGMSFLALSNMIFTYFLGQEKYNYLYSLILCAALTFGAILIKFHHSPMEIALSLTLGSFVNWIVSLFILYWPKIKFKTIFH